VGSGVRIRATRPNLSFWETTGSGALLAHPAESSRAFNFFGFCRISRNARSRSSTCVPERAPKGWLIAAAQPVRDGPSPRGSGLDSACAPLLSVLAARTEGAQGLLRPGRKPRVIRVQFEADRSDRNDDAAIACRVELAAQIADLHVDNVGVRRGLEIPNILEQHRPSTNQTCSPTPPRSAAASRRRSRRKARAPRAPPAAEPT
jgi:hypothetical protein